MFSVRRSQAEVSQEGDGQLQQEAGPGDNVKKLFAQVDVAFAK